MPLITAIEIEADIAEWHADTDIWHRIVHGPVSGATSLVMTEGGEVPTIARSVSGIGSIGFAYTTLASLDADLTDRAQYTRVTVESDPTPANNGVYHNTSATSVNVWVKINDLPASQPFVITATADRSMGGFKLRDLAAPLVSGDAANYGFVVTATQTRSMGGFILSGLGEPVAGSDAATRNHVLTATENRSMGNFRLTGLDPPISASDATRKDYVDTITSLALLTTVGPNATPLA